jgi:hypothetical protein
MSEFKLIQEIIKKSVNPIWELAKLEWELANVEDSEEEQTCLCGHYPIKELCLLANKENGNTVIVGNCCVKKFVGIRSDKVFNAFKRVRKDSEKSFNEDTINLALGRNWITGWEKNFYLDIKGKRTLTHKQMTIKQRVNAKILLRMGRVR